MFMDMVEFGVGASFVNRHLIIELLAALTLILSVGVEIRTLVRLLRRQDQLVRGLQIASGALHDLMQAYYDSWGLTPSEQDVAGFVIKGLSIAEIADLRGTAPGTVKAHLNAIYRKSGVTGRGELLSLLIEDLMATPLLDEAETQRSAAEWGGRGWKYPPRSV
ncbi:helix-turn-helix transcriptional regulator [Rhodobacteraceae bacterium GS-10]|uniref:Helix-turn-helix transcriptional regulator n=2 Tax=Thalassovita mangrovi TaxID=2692236 RepID=A0A6L8LEX3_9RHOB|nr:helix-turn-helix transcriptional regulator [Thalassovita mangrovi]